MKYHSKFAICCLTVHQDKYYLILQLLRLSETLLVNNSGVYKQMVSPNVICCLVR